SLRSGGFCFCFSLACPRLRGSWGSGLVGAEDDRRRTKGALPVRGRASRACCSAERDETCEDIDRALVSGYSNYMRTAKGQAASLRPAGGPRRRQPREQPRPSQARESAPPRTREAKVVAIGNSRGVRLPKAVLARYAIGDAVLLEEREEGLLLRSRGDERLSWEDTYKDMAREREDWSDLDTTLGDGLDEGRW